MTAVVAAAALPLRGEVSAVTAATAAAPQLTVVRRRGGRTSCYVRERHLRLAGAAMGRLATLVVLGLRSLGGEGVLRGADCP